MRFSTTVEEYPTLRQDDYTDEEHLACFWRDEELDKTLAKCRKIVANHHGLNYCTRGLESLLDERCSYEKQEALEAVLTSHKNESAQDIADRYMALSESCQTRALELAQLDEVSASNYLLKE